ncbi:MAG: hypothetical protein IT427_01220 [Pirellulales bacterium]|nr:hypothetical protein [Pirellulales bacterium]
MAQARIPVPPSLPTPPPMPLAMAAQPIEAHSCRTQVSSFATSFGVHCLAIILLGLYTYREHLVGNRGSGEVALAWQESSGEELFDLDTGARSGEAELTVNIEAPQAAPEWSTAATERFSELSSSLPELKIELPGAGKSSKSAAALSGLLGSGSADSGEGMGLGKGHGYGRTQFFGIEAEGNSFIYVFDRSLSMTSYDSVPLRAAKMELLSSVEHLQERQQFYTVFYNHEPWMYELPGLSRGRLQFATPENKGLFRDFVYRLQADGGTHHLTALEIAIRKRPDVIYLLTDGEPQDDLTRAELQKLTRMNSGGASIHVIQFTLEPRPESTLVQLAKLNRGKHRFVNIRRLVDRLAEAANPM